MRASRITLSEFLLAWALLMGAFVRLILPILSPFPVNDGGLFYVMIQDIIQNGFHLPAFTSFNSANIPFSYPPLALLLASWISAYFNISVIQLLRWLPPLISMLLIPVYYLLATAILKSRFQAALATTAFAMLPRTYDIACMGGGITRAFGFLFM